MAIILGIETSTSVCSVALSIDGVTIQSKENRVGLSHASHLTVLIKSLFNDIEKHTINDIDAVAVSIGPGSYTGLRIGMSAAKGICYALNKKLIGISSLEILAWAVQDSNNPLVDDSSLLCPMIDARRMEVYTAFYDLQMNLKSDISAIIVDGNSFNDTLEKQTLFFFGNGSDKCKQVIKHPHAKFINDVHPLAQNISIPAYNAYKQGKFEDVAYFEPFYLKDFVATTPKNRVF